MFRLWQINVLHTVKEKNDLEEWSRVQSNIHIIFYYYKKRIVNTIYIHLSPTCSLVIYVDTYYETRFVKGGKSFYSMVYTVYLLFAAATTVSNKVLLSLEPVLLSHP